MRPASSKCPESRIALAARVFWLLVSACLLGACSDNNGQDESSAVLIDGSSTVYPISEAIAEEYLRQSPGVRVTVGVSGTGGGFKKFLAGEVDINDASRVISPSEIEEAAESGLEYLELPVAYDGLSVLVNPQNDWVDYMTLEELSMIWRPGSQVDSWNDVREEWPDEPIRLYGPGTDSGTFDYFTEAVNGRSGASRPDYTASEDDNVLVQGINGDRAGLGFFGYAYFAANPEKLKLVAIDSGSGPVVPTMDSINDGTYTPLSRPIYIYVNKTSLERPEVRQFVRFYLENAGLLAREVGYIELPDEEYERSLQILDAQ